MFFRFYATTVCYFIFPLFLTLAILLLCHYRMLLSFPTFSNSCSSVSMPLPYATACNSLSDNVSLSSKHLPNSSKELLPTVPGVYVVSLFQTKCTFHLNHLCLIFVFSVSIKSNHHLVCNSVMSFEPAPVNVSFATVNVGVNLVKSVSCHFLCIFFSETHVYQFKPSLLFKCF